MSHTLNKLHELKFSVLAAGSDYTAISIPITFASGSSMGPPPARLCTSVPILPDNLLEVEFETVPLNASSTDPDVLFTPAGATFPFGGDSAVISIQDDESE